MVAKVERIIQVSVFVVYAELKEIKNSFFKTVID